MPMPMTGSWAATRGRRLDPRGGIAASSPLTVRIGEEAFYRQVELDEHGAYELTSGS